MKKLALILILSVSFSAFSQVSLKGYTLGQKLKGPDEKETTVAGIEGGLAAYTLKNGKIHTVNFMPMKSNWRSMGDYEEIRQPLSKEDLDFFIEAIQDYYEIEFTPGINYTYAALKDDVLFTLDVEGDDPEFYVLFSIVSSKMMKKQRAELKSDF